MIGTRTGRVLELLADPLRRRSGLGWLLTAVAAVLACFAVAAWLLRTGVGRSGLWVFIAWGVSAVAVGAVASLAWREWRSLAPLPLARRLEDTGTVRRGLLLALLDRAALGTSEELAEAADIGTAARLVTEAPSVLVPLVDRLRRRLVLVATILLVAVGALAASGPGQGRVRLLWNLSAALELVRARISLRAEPDVVDRGAAVTLRLEAVGQRSAVLWSRAPGQPWSGTPISLDSVGVSTLQISSVQSDLFFRLTSGRRSSDTVVVRVRLPAFLGALRVTARYPRYLGLEDEPLPTGGDSLLVPAGTSLDTEGEASTGLASARWVAGPRSVALTTRGRRFGGRMVPSSSAEYELALVASDGAPMAGEPIRLAVVVVPDSVPLVEVPVPGADTIASLDLRIPLVVDARDDHGLIRVEVVSRAGRETGNTVESLALATPVSDRALLELTLDLSSRRLMPGDTVRYFAQATDNSPSRQVGRSREYVVVVPTSADQRSAQREASRDAARRLDSLVASSRQLERQTEDLARERQRATEASRGDPSLAFEDAKRSEAVARTQEELIRQAEELRQTLDALEQAAQRGEAPDSALARRLAEISEQIDKALSPELRKRLAELQRALKDLDPQATQEALKQLAEVQQALRQALERSRDLFKRAALEGELGTLAQDARDMAKAQREWNDRVAKADSSEASLAEHALAERTDSLASNLARVAEQLEQPTAGEQTAAAAAQAKQAAEQMRGAGSAAQSGQRRQARSQGEAAQSTMEKVSQDTEALKERQQEEWKQEVLDGLDRAMAETARLSRQQLGVANAFRRGAAITPTRSEQALAEESVQKVIEQVEVVSGKNALVSPQILVALVVARSQMGLARESVSSASPNLQDAADQAGEAVDALNVAAFQMVRARDDVAGSSSGSGLAEALEKMAQMAERQGQLSQQTGGLLSMAGSSALQQVLQSLAARQRALAQEMERMRAQGQIPGSQEMGEEARELSRKLEAGRLDRETVERQERLFRRMLDAGRTLQGEERDEKKERQSTTARPGELRLPPALRDRMGGSGPIRFPAWDQLQRFSPEERRLVTEYFRRLTSSGTR